MPITKKTVEKYKLVIDAYFSNGFNGAAAYRSIYPNTVRPDDSFSKIQKHQEVKDYVALKQSRAKEVLRTSHEALLKELENWAYSDITQTLNLTPQQVKQLPENIRRLITKFKHTKRQVRDAKGKVVETIEVVELQFVDKTKAIEMINKHTGFYEADNRQKQPVQSVNLSGFSIEEKTKILEKIREQQG